MEQEKQEDVDESVAVKVPVSGAVLIDRAALDLIKFAGDDSTPSYLAGLNITPKWTETTNGHIAVRLAHSGMSVAEFPVVEGDNGGAVPAGGVRIPTSAIERVAKALPKRGHIPILGMAKVGGLADDGACLVTTDLEVPTILRTKMEGRFPDLDKVIPAPETRPVKVAFQAKYLKLIAEWAIKHGGGNTCPVLFELSEKEAATDAASIKIEMDDGRTLWVVLMPIKPAEV